MCNAISPALGGAGRGHSPVLNSVLAPARLCSHTQSLPQSGSAVTLSPGPNLALYSVLAPARLCSQSLPPPGSAALGTAGKALGRSSRVPALVEADLCGCSEKSPRALSKPFFPCQTCSCCSPPHPAGTAPVRASIPSLLLALLPAATARPLILLHPASDVGSSSPAPLQLAP